MVLKLKISNIFQSALHKDSHPLSEISLLPIWFEIYLKTCVRDIANIPFEGINTLSPQ